MFIPPFLQLLLLQECGIVSRPLQGSSLVYLVEAMGCAHSSGIERCATVCYVPATFPNPPKVLPPNQATHDQHVGQLNAFLVKVAQSPRTLEKIVARRREWDFSEDLHGSKGGEDLPCVPDCTTEAL